MSASTARVPDPARHVLAAREGIVVTFGGPSQAPTDDHMPYPPGF